MRLTILPTGDISFTNLHPLEAGALLAIPHHASAVDVPGVEERLYPPLTANPEEGEHDPFETARDQEDWEEFVVPELRELFEGSIARVSETLKQLTPAPYDASVDDDDDEEDEEDEEICDDDVDSSLKLQEEPPPSDLAQFPNFKLTIPRAQADDWFRAMNQARLLMAQKSLWIEENGNLHGPFLDQIHYEIYTGVQEWLVQNVLSDSI
jgi:hypothetical protein